MRTRSTRTWMRRAFAGVLLAWAAGIVAATWQLHAWQVELTQVLMQLRADDLLRSSVKGHDEVRPEWYRRRASSLLGAVERLRENTAWTLAMPGSWRAFDDIQDRAAQRVDRAFAQVVVETIRRELERRAAALTGVPLSAAGGELAAVRQCGPLRAAEPAAPSLRLEDQPVFATLDAQLRELASLDSAVGTLVALREAGQARPQALQQLVRYSLGAELSGDVSRSLVLFRSGQTDAQAAALLERVQEAVRCSVVSNFEALHRRWLSDNEFLRNEDALGRLTPALLLAPPGPEHEASRARLLQATALMARQEMLLASVSTQRAGWIAAPDDLGPAYQRLLRQAAANRLLGPGFAQAMQAQARAAQVTWRSRLNAHMARRPAAVAWKTPDAQLAATPERIAWRRALEALLHAPFLVPEAMPVPLRTASWAPPANFDQLATLAEQRRRFQKDVLPLFGPAQRPLAMRYVDDQLVQRALEHVVAQLTPPGDGSPAQLVLQNAVANVALAQTTLADAGVPALAARLRTRVEGEVLVPLLKAAASAMQQASPGALQTSGGMFTSAPPAD